MMMMTCFHIWVNDEKAGTRNHLQPPLEVLIISRTDKLWKGNDSGFHTWS